VQRHRRQVGRADRHRQSPQASPLRSALDGLCLATRRRALGLPTKVAALTAATRERLLPRRARDRNGSHAGIQSSVAGLGFRSCGLLHVAFPRGCATCKSIAISCADVRELTSREVQQSPLSVGAVVRGLQSTSFWAKAPRPTRHGLLPITAIAQATGDSQNAVACSIGSEPWLRRLPLTTSVNRSGHPPVLERSSHRGRVRCSTQFALAHTMARHAQC
jgi:hypothetical protein